MEWWLDCLQVNVMTHRRPPMNLCIGNLLCSDKTLANGPMRSMTDTVELLTSCKCEPKHCDIVSKTPSGRSRNVLATPTSP